VAARIASLVLMTTLLVPVRAVASDPVLDWIKIMNDTVLASATSPLVTSRNTGLVGAAIFDAVNGIEKRYDPLIVDKYTGTHASARAAAIKAAYTTLVAGTVKQFSAFSEAPSEIHNARVWGGIHWRTACLQGSKLGKDVANWVMANAMKDHGDH
jgi:hypothetical protein